jgi:hypothetical protein
MTSPAIYSVVMLTGGTPVTVQGQPDRIADDLVEAGYTTRIMLDGDAITLMAPHVVYIERAPEGATT